MQIFMHDKNTFSSAATSWIFCELSQAKILESQAESFKPFQILALLLKFKSLFQVSRLGVYVFLCLYHLESECLLNKSIYVLETILTQF